MSLDYRPPSVTITEEVSPQISSSLATPAVPCLVGVAAGSQTRTDQFVLSGTTATRLPNLPEGATLQAITSVIDSYDPSKGASDGSGYVLTTDYTTVAANGTITRVAAGGIADGRVVNVTYRYVDSTYYEAQSHRDLASIEAKYGTALKSDGTGINSALSYAASIAFENGASEIVLQPLFKLTTPSDPLSVRLQPNATEVANSATWSTTLASLRARDDVNLITPVIGQSDTSVGDSTLLSIFQVIQDHIRYMQTQDQFIVGIFGEDKSASNTVASAATIRSHATTLKGRYGGLTAQQTVLLNTAKFSKSLPSTGQAIVLGGQYAAVALQGAVASRSVSSSLTRKYLSGLNSILDPRGLQDKNLDAQAGLLVLDQKGQNIQVRHAITLDDSSSATRELSVVRAKHRMIESLRDTIDTQIIGQIVADNQATDQVATTITAVLESLRQGKDIVDYGNVSARLLTNDPTTIEVKFSYRPAFPINYVNISFSIDLSAGTVTTDTTTAL